MTRRTGLFLFIEVPVCWSSRASPGSLCSMIRRQATPSFDLAHVAVRKTQIIGMTTVFIVTYTQVTGWLLDARKEIPAAWYSGYFQLGYLLMSCSCSANIQL